MSEFGLVEMTRQRNRESLMQTMFTSCPYCSGSGLIKTHESVAIEIERALKKLVLQQQQFALELISHPSLDHYLSHTDKNYFRKLADKWNADLKFASNDALHLNEFQFYSTTNGKRLDI
jgi:ribonuclease G